jgi:hypothetical protein
VPLISLPDSVVVVVPHSLTLEVMLSTAGIDEAPALASWAELVSTLVWLLPKVSDVVSV